MKVDDIIAFSLSLQVKRSSHKRKDMES